MNHINELNVFPNSVVEVATAVPAFVGYTQQATNQGLQRFYLYQSECE